MLDLETIVFYIASMTNQLTQPITTPKSRGRPREFDMTDALDKAVRVFSERGYHATSITDLSDAMELSQGSVYKAFKDKKAVFLAAFDHYRARQNRRIEEASRTGRTGLERLRAAMTFYAEVSCGPEGEQGCLVVATATDLATFDEEVAARVRFSFDKRQELIAGFIRAGQADGSIPETLVCDDVSRAMLCLLQGMRIVGKTGHSRSDMMAVVEVAVKMAA